MTEALANALPVAKRLRRLAGVMGDRDLDAVVLASYEAVSYFGGVHLFTQTLVPDRSAFVVARRDGEATLVVCDIEESLVRTQTPLDDVRVYVEFAEDPASVGAAVVLESAGASARVGIESRRLPAASVAALERAAELELVPIDHEIEATQMLKDNVEVRLLERAARATQAAVEDAIAAARGGMSERAVAGEIAANLVAHGGAPVFLVFGAGERALLAHAEATDHPLTVGDVIRIDACARFELGLLGDLARTAVVGEPATAQEDVLAVLRFAQDETFALVEPGRPVSELYRRCKEVIESAHLPFSMPHIGHGLGIGLHEAPHIHPANETPLAAGMVINIEPFVVLHDRVEAYHVEDLVLVADGGPRLLSTPQEHLLRVEVT